jgi:hypothetical protein
VGAFAPLDQSREGGKGDSAWGGRESARRQAAYERGDARRGGSDARHGDDWGCGGGHAGRGHNVRQAPEEEEAGILHPKVGDRSPIRRTVEMSESLTFSFSHSQGGAHRAPLRTCQGVEVGRGRPH